METKKATLPVRLNSLSKKVIENAASYLGISASAFMVHHAYQAAKDILREEHLVLSDEEWLLFMNTLENPPEPNEALCMLMSE